MDVTSSLSQEASPQLNESTKTPREGFCGVELGLVAYGLSSGALLHRPFLPLKGN